MFLVLIGRTPEIATHTEKRAREIAERIAMEIYTELGCRDEDEIPNPRRDGVEAWNAFWIKAGSEPSAITWQPLPVDQEVGG